MRLLMTADAAGGVWTYSLDLAEALRERGFEVHLACLGPALSEPRRLQARRSCHALHEGNFRLEWMEDPWEDVERAGRWLLDLERRVGPDAVHLNDFCSGALPWSVPSVVVGHSCVLSWHEAVRGSQAPPEWERYRREVAWGLRSATAVVAPTRAMLASLERHYGPLPHPRAILNGRSLAYRPGAKEPWILSVGRLWDEGKNVALLDRLADDLDWSVAVAGETWSPQGGSVRAHRVRTLGRLGQEALAEWLSGASVYAHPALYEPFGLAPLEAAQAGCALVLSDLETLREIWGEAALFVAPDDVAAWREALNGLARDRGRLRVLARAASQRARELTANRMAGAYEELYRSLADLERRPVLPPSRRTE